MSGYDKDFYLKIAMINIDNALKAMEDVTEDREVRNELKQMKNRLEGIREEAE